MGQPTSIPWDAIIPMALVAVAVADNLVATKNQQNKPSQKYAQSFREVFRCFLEVWGELEANGPQNQLEHQILLQIHLS